MSALPKRLLSIDVLRAVTMFLMIFVNDASGVRHIPEWIDHAKGFEDRMGFADTIFPAFLFIVGLSLPLAINSRIKKGDSPKQVFFYIFIRSAALLIMGFYHVNLENYNLDAALIPRAVWELVITLAFFLIWLDYPETLSKVKKYSLIGLGFAMLIAMAIVYRGGDDGAAGGMTPSWWGILGIIGWSYLVCALLYYVLKGKLNAMIVCWLVLMAINIVFHTAFPKANVWVLGDGSSPALVMSGIVVMCVYSRLVELNSTQRLWLTLFILGVGFIVAGFLIRPYTAGISKIRGTPAWVLICSGITTLVFELLIYLVDVRGNKNLFSWVRPAGTSTLTCYLIPYFQVALLELFHVKYPKILNNGAIGLVRSFATSFIIILLVGLMEKKRLRLKI